jgi:hypothetical protein
VDEEKDVSDFFNPPEERRARNNHQCTYCGEDIRAGDRYTYQKGNWDGRWFESKMHPECFDDMCESGDGEYTPFSNERPERNP